jgi:hypothetical protein
VALDGDTAIIGAPGYDDWKGAVYVYQRPADGSWRLKKEFWGGKGNVHAGIGNAIAIDGDLALLGAPVGNPASALVKEGIVHLLKRDPQEGWSLRPNSLKSPEPPSPNFGFSVAMKKGCAIVGNYRQEYTAPNKYFPGEAYAFCLSADDKDDKFDLLKKLVPPSGHPLPQQNGIRVGTNGQDVMIVGPEVIVY